MRPGQLSPHCGDNLFVGKSRSEPETMPQLSLAPAFAVGLGELSGEVDDFLFAIFAPLSLQYLGLNAVANLPIQQGDFSVDGNGGALFGGVDELADFLKQRVDRSSQIISHTAIASCSMFAKWLWIASS
jgi:hypothetical protein